MDRDVARRADGEADRREVLENVEREVLEKETRVDVGARGAVSDGVTVRAGARESLRGLRSAGGGLEFDHHRLAEARAHLRGHEAQRSVAARARRGGAEYEDRLAWVGRRPGRTRGEGRGPAPRPNADPPPTLLPRPPRRQ